MKIEEKIKKEYQEKQCWTWKDEDDNFKIEEESPSIYQIEKKYPGTNRDQIKFIKFIKRSEHGDK